MTAVAFRDGVMAADTGTWFGDVVVGDSRKIARFSDGSLFAAQGDGECIAAYIMWQFGELKERPEPVDKPELFFGLRAWPNGLLCWIGGLTYKPYLVGQKYAALGGAAEFLYGALAAGASAEEAVRLAIKYHGHASGDVQVERLEP